MIGRLGIAAGSVCLAWVMTGSGMAGAQPWQPRDPDGCTLGGTMGRGCERQIILKTHSDDDVLELDLGKKFQAKSGGWDENHRQGGHLRGICRGQTGGAEASRPQVIENLNELRVGI